MKRTALFILSLTAVITTFIGSAASATPISYDESVDGPLPSNFVPGVPGGPSLADFLTLDVGMNLFSGTATIDAATNTFEFDTAPVILPIGLATTSITLTVTNVQGTLSDVGPAVYGYDAGVTTILTAFFDNAIPPFSDTPVFTSNLPLSAPGNYGIAFSGFVYAFPGATFDYTWKITVAPVVIPEPSTTILAILLAGGLAVLARRRRAA